MLEPGLRVDHATINGQTSVSPRMTGNQGLSASTRMKLGAGLYTQSPGYEKLIQSDYFLDLGGAQTLPLQVEKSLHVLLGLERDLAPGVVGRVEGYYKDFDDLIIGRLETPDETLARVSRYDFPPELAGSIPNGPMITTLPTNDGRGRAYGFDVYVAKRATSADTRLTGWASYTFGVAEQQAYGREYPFDYHRRHALSAVGSLRIGNRLEKQLEGWRWFPVLSLTLSRRF